jgi:oligopeptidase A
MKLYLSVTAILGMTTSVTSVRAFTSRFTNRILSSTRRGGSATLSSSSSARTMADTAVAPAVSTTNGFLQMDGLPKFNVIEPQDLTPAVENLLESLDKDFAAMEESLATTTSTPSYDEVLPKLEQIQFGIGYAWGIAGHLNGVKNGDELRQAYESNQPKVVQAMTKFSQSKPLYDALVKIEQAWAASSSDKDESKEDEFVMQQKRRAVEQNLQAMTLGGVGLEGAQKERFNEIKMKLAALSTKFSNNVLDETKAFSVTVETPESMVGVPASAKAQWAQAHAAFVNKDQKEGEEPFVSNPEQGPWRLTLDMPSYLPALQHLPDRALREQMYRANLGRASDASENVEKNNVPLIYEIVQLKVRTLFVAGTC